MMKKIINGLFVGNQEDYESHVKNISSKDVIECWAYVLAAKEPFHRAAIGYKGRACDKSHPEYLIARRDNNLVLNLVDAPKSEFFNKDIIDTALDFIEEQLKERHMSVLICCNQGESRSPSLALLYLIKHGLIEGDTLEDVEAEFLKVYPEYNPGTGMRGFVKENFEKYKSRFKIMHAGDRFGGRADGRKLKESIEFLAETLAEDK